MTKCRDCKHFSAAYNGQLSWLGTCRLVLPDWMDRVFEDYSRVVREDSGCDLGVDASKEEG